MKHFAISFIVLLCGLNALTQVSVNTNGNPPDPSAILDVSSTSRGMLMPRMTNEERNTITNPAEGLQIFNTSTHCFEAFVNGGWYNVSCPGPCFAPSTPSFSEYTSEPCGSSINYSITPADDYANYYEWSLPDFTIINAGQGTPAVNVTFGGVGGEICVIARNSCGVSDPLCSGVTLTNLPDAAGPISGSTTACQGTAGFSYSIAEVNNATGYQWTLPPGATLLSGDNTNSITVRFSASAQSGNIVVHPNSACGNGEPSLLYITLLPMTALANPTNNQSTSFTANWSATEGATGYYLDVLTSFNGIDTPVAGYNNLSVGNVTSYEVTGLTPGLIYSYKVKAVHDECISGSAACTACTEPASLGCSGNPGANCLAIKNANSSAPNGKYWIDPNGNGPEDAFPVYCDMTTDGGGWTYVDRGPNLSTSSFGSVSTDPEVESSWHLSENVIRSLYSDNQTYQIYTWSNSFDEDRIRIFRPKTDFSLTMSLNEVWNGTEFTNGNGGSMGSFNSGPHCVLRTNILDMVNAQSNMHWGYNGATTNYVRCVREAEGATNGLIFIR